MSDQELILCDSLVQGNYNIKLFMVKSKDMYKPSLDTMYHNEAEAVMTNIPEDLQLPVVFGA